MMEGVAFEQIRRGIIGWHYKAGRSRGKEKEVNVCVLARGTRVAIILYSLFQAQEDWRRFSDGLLAMVVPGPGKMPWLSRDQV